jgi:hypothetical protein
LAETIAFAAKSHAACDTIFHCIVGLKGRGSLHDHVCDGTTNNMAVNFAKLPELLRKAWRF